MSTYPKSPNAKEHMPIQLAMTRAFHHIHHPTINSHESDNDALQMANSLKQQFRIAQ